MWRGWWSGGGVFEDKRLVRVAFQAVAGCLTGCGGDRGKKTRFAQAGTGD